MKSPWCPLLCPASILISLLSFMTLFSCRTIPNSKTSSDSNAKGLVLIQCLVTQGNGGNWGGTLAWMSETIRVRSEEARQIQTQTGQPVQMFLDCAAGGSSGSVATQVYGALLHNDSLLPGHKENRLFSVNEADRIADALRWIGFSADLSIFEYTNTLRQVIGEGIEGKVTGTLGRVEELRDFVRKALGNKNPTWWNNQTVEAEQVLVDFIVMVRFAGTMTPELLGKLSPADVISQLDPSKNRLVDVPVYNSLAEVPRAEGEVKNIDAALAKRTALINSESDAFIAKPFGPGVYKARYLSGVYENAPTLLKQVAEAPMPQGFCTITMAMIAATEQDIPLDKAPDYSQLHPTVFCNRSTIDKILGQPQFREDLQAESPQLKRYLFLAAKNIRTALAMSIREPNMMQEFKGSIGNSRVEADALFDSMTSDRASPTLKPGAGMGIGIAGGWPDRRITAWPMTYYALAIAEKWQAQGYQVKGYVSKFGKPDNRSKDKFDTTAIRTVFSPDAKTGEKYVQEWFQWQDQYCDLFAPRLAAAGFLDETVAFNWDIGSIPAAQSGNSRRLVYKGINAVRLQAKETVRRVSFDPTVDSDSISIKSIIPCKP